LPVDCIRQCDFRPWPNVCSSALYGHS